MRRPPFIFRGEQPSPGEVAESSPRREPCGTGASEHESAPEGRERIAHGVSRVEPAPYEPSPVGAKDIPLILYRPAGAWHRGLPFPTAHAVGYFLPPLRGCARRLVNLG